MIPWALAVMLPPRLRADAAERLGVRIPPRSLRRFWMMLAHYHGQVLNTSELGRSLGMSDKTVRRYMDVLSATFMIRQLAPWHSSTAKRQVRSPKIYFRDNGILHHHNYTIDNPTRYR